MIVGNIEIVTILVILLSGIPLMFSAIKKNIFKEFSIGQLTRATNSALITQVIIALISILSMSYFESKYYSNGQSNSLTDIWMETGLTYLVVVTFFYIPVLIILNIINLILRKKSTLTNE